MHFGTGCLGHSHTLLHLQGHKYLLLLVNLIEEILTSAEIVNHFARLITSSKHGSDSWYRLPIYDLLPSSLKDQANLLEKGYEIFHSDFDQALTWNFVLKDGKFMETNKISLDISNKLKTITLSEQSDIS